MFTIGNYMSGIEAGCKMKAEGDVAEVDAREFSDKKRKKLAKSGVAMPHGGFPIQNKQDLKNAERAIGRAKNPAATRRHIRKRAAALGVQLSDAFQATGTSEGASKGWDTRGRGAKGKDLKDINYLSKKHAGSNIYERGPALNKQELSRAIDHIRQGRAYYDVDEGRLDVAKKGSSYPQSMRDEHVQALTADVKQARKQGYYVGQ